jgi:hypothetical protein
MLSSVTRLVRRGPLRRKDMADLLEIACSVIDDTGKLNTLQNQAFEDCEAVCSLG